MSREHSLRLIGAAALLAGCSAKALRRVRVASSSSGENTTIAEIYALALERAGIPADRRMNLGSPQVVMAALLHGDVDLYPGDTAGLVRKAFYEKRYGITWFEPSPATDSPCLATSQYAAERYWLLTLSKCSAIAGSLRLAATPDFVAPGGALHRLRDFYGGFDFRKIVICEPGTQYYALNRDAADVANATTTDAELPEDQLIILRDDEEFWPQHHATPIVSVASIRSHPHMRDVLNRVSRTLTQYAVQNMNMRRQLLNLDPHDVAEDFFNR